MNQVEEITCPRCGVQFPADHREGDLLRRAYQFVKYAARNSDSEEASELHDELKALGYDVS